MSAPLVRFTLTGLAEQVQRLSYALDDGVPEAAERGAVFVAEQAARAHTFQNRTGELEASITARPATGLFTRDTLVVEVAAEADYASYVEYDVADDPPDQPGGLSPRPFLRPAWESQEQVFGAEIEQALAAAAKRAGW